MKITISAILDETQIAILATQKGYQDTILSGEDRIPNTQSKEDFIREVYEGTILTDATREFVSFSNKQKEEARIEEEKAIREQVRASISSSVWN